jgi:hypothetical protein
MAPCGGELARSVGDHALVLTNLVAIFPVVTLALKRHYASAALVAVAGGVSFVFHMCFKGWGCATLDRERLDVLDFFFAANLAVVVSFVLNDGTATAGHPAYARWRRWRSLIAVVLLCLLVLLAHGDHHRKVMPVVGAIVGVANLLAHYPVHITWDPALKARCTRLAVVMSFALAMLLASLGLLHTRGAWFRLTHSLWHSVVFSFIGVIGLCVPPNYRPAAPVMPTAQGAAAKTLASRRRRGR